MNLEIQYPELKTMRSSEIFIEWAYIIKSKNIIKIHVGRIIPKKEKTIFVKALKLEYNIVKNYDSIFEDVVQLITIEK